MERDRIIVAWKAQMLGVSAEPHGAADSQLLGQIGRHDAVPAESVAVNLESFSAGNLVRSERSMWSDEHSILVVPTDCFSVSFPHDFVEQAPSFCDATTVYASRAGESVDCPGTFDQTTYRVRSIYVALAHSSFARQQPTDEERILDSMVSRTCGSDWL